MTLQKDKDILRALAFKVREIAESDENIKKQREAGRLNNMQYGRPLVYCYPEGAWDELVTLSDCITSEPVLKEFELALRRSIFQAEEIGDDSGIWNRFNIGVEVQSTGYGLEPVYHRTVPRGAASWDAPITDISRDIKKLRYREFIVNKQGALEKAALADSIFGDLLSPSINCGGAWWSLGMCEDAIHLVGIENFMLFMYDDPDGMHRLMSWLRDEHINAIKWFEENECFLSDGKPVKIKDMQGFSEAQEATTISPEMFYEFIIRYQCDVVKDFARNHYGCCEPVHDRWDYVKKIPKLFKVSISPWCDQKIMADKLKRDYIYNRKPNPSPVCIGFDEKAIRDDIIFTLETAGSNLLEIVLKDTHTVENDKTRFARFVKIAREEIDKRF